MAHVIDMEAKKLERSEHSAGPARCLDCKHEWVAVVPVGVLWLECPGCGLVRGRMRYPHERDVPHWGCNCGNDLFVVTEDGVYCPNCGVWQNPWD